MTGQVWLIVAAIVAAAVAGIGILVARSRRLNPTVVSISVDDAEMNAAMARARAGQPVFWKDWAGPAPDETGFALKVKITDGDAVEHFWCLPVTGSPEAPSCAIDAAPEIVRNVREGQVIDVDPEQISDWMYMKGEKIRGGETIRALLPHLPKDQADAMRAKFD
jgi:uncharacterized protein YegJ (DUF2314 family)